MTFSDLRTVECMDHIAVIKTTHRSVLFDLPPGLIEAVI